MRVWSLLALLLMAALAGCAGDPEVVEPTTTADDVEDTPTPESEIDEEVEEAEESLLTFTATLTLQETAILAGTPFNVSIETDLPADAAANATWNAIVVGADLAVIDEREGTGAPAAFNLTVPDAGNHSIGITVRAAGYEDAASNATFVVDAPGEAVEAPFESVSVSQAITASCFECVMAQGTRDSPCIGVAADMNGLDCAWFEVDPSWIGHSAAISGLFVYAMEFYPDCTATGLLEYHLQEAAVIPEGVGCILAYDHVDVVVTAVLTVS